MSTMTFVGRLGRDGELRYLPDGSAVMNLAVAYNYGRKGQDGKKPSQWVDCAIFGKRAEAMAQYLVKGTQLFLVLDDVHVNQFTKADGTQSASLKGVVQKIDFVGSAPQQSAPAQQQQRAQAPAPKPQQAPPPAFDDFDTDSIPF